VDYVLKKGGHKDLYRIYPMMTFDYPRAARVGQAYLHGAFLNGAADLLLLKDENGLETGYAVVFKKSRYGYVLIACLSIYPPFRESGAEARFLLLIGARYADRQGIFAWVPGGSSAAAESRRARLAALGYGDVACTLEVGGAEAALLCLRLAGKADPSPAAPCIIRDLVAGIIPERCGSFPIRVRAR
jgi:hypothetical protein